jgi:hypothetical protein
MTDVHDPVVRRDIVSRLDMLGRDTEPGWGNMTPAAVLFHLNAGMRMALGELVAEPVGDAAFWHSEGKAIALGEDPWPESAPTSPEALPERPVDLETERVQFVVLIERIAERERSGDWPAHPRLGPLTGGEWSRFTFTHVQHHFRQFGV